MHAINLHSTTAAVLEENKAVMWRLYEGTNEGNLGIIDEVYAPNAIYHWSGMMAHSGQCS